MLNGMILCLHMNELNSATCWDKTGSAQKSVPLQWCCICQASRVSFICHREHEAFSRVCIELFVKISTTWRYCTNCQALPSAAAENFPLSGWYMTKQTLANVSPIKPPSTFPACPSARRAKQRSSPDVSMWQLPPSVCPLAECQPSLHSM